jgi:hypothetical protein
VPSASRNAPTNRAQIYYTERMFIGHYGVSLAAKRSAPELSLGWLFLAVQGLDVLFAIFVLLDMEHLKIVPGFTASNPYDLFDMPITHSLVGSAAWSVVAVLIARVSKLSWRAAGVLGFAMFSHFVLDIPMHTPDLSVAGPGTLMLGFGLWNHRLLALAVELLCFGAGVLVYVRSFAPVSRGFWIMVGVMTVLALATPFMPAPGGTLEFAVQALLAYVALAYWASRVDARSRARERRVDVKAE